jgi:hypothetical protein
MEKLDFKLHKFVAERKSNIITECLFGKKLDAYFLKLAKIPIKTQLLADKINSFCDEKGLVNFTLRKDFFGDQFNCVKGVLSHSTLTLSIERLISLAYLLDLEVGYFVDWNEVNLKPELILPKYKSLFTKFADSNSGVALDCFFSRKFNSTTTTSKKFLKHLETNGISVNGQKDVDQKIRDLRQLILK